MGDFEERRIRADLYRALSEGDDGKVCDICSLLQRGPLHRLTIHGDTVLHIAGYHKRNKLILNLLCMVPISDSYLLTTIKNEAGETILHATTNNETVEAALEILRLAPSLLTMRDGLGETPFFRAARYGETQSFSFLKNEMLRMFPPDRDDLRTFLVRNDKATILHAAIQSDNFHLAHDVAQTYPLLIGAKDGDGMTALQLLACKPSVFKHGFEENFFKLLISKFIDPMGHRSSRVPILKEVDKQKLKSESAKKLAAHLLKYDVSWEETDPMPNQKRSKFHKYGRLDIINDVPMYKNIVIHTTPDSVLILATKSGCTEIVKGILQMYAHAAEHIDKDGRNILHVAILYRRMEIYNTVINMTYPFMRIRGGIDKEGNSLLHMVAQKATDLIGEVDIRIPAHLLRDDLLLFENVKSICTSLATSQVNSDGLTAKQLFINNNAQLRIDAKEWMKSTAGGCVGVAVTIATVSFAAAYTVPGGPNQNTGHALLKNKPFFIVFALADALSLAFSLTSVILFLSILTSTFRFKDFKDSLPSKLLLGFTLLILSVAMMMVAFAATLILTISGKRDWTNILLYTVSFFPFALFVCSYVNLYTLLFKEFVERLKKVMYSILPTRDDESPKRMQHPRHPSQAPTTSSPV